MANTKWKVRYPLLDPSHFLVILLVASGVASYAVEGGKAAFYGVAIISLVGMFVINQRFRVAATVKPIFFVAFVSFLFTIISLLRAEITSLSAMLQVLLYPVVFVLISVSFSPVHNREALRRVFFNLVFLVGFVNAFFSFLSISAGSITLPLLGELERGRAIFFLDVRSASGLLNNENYYSAVQALAFWSGFAVRSGSTVKRLMLVVVGLSVFTGASRSVSAIFILSVLSYLYFFQVRRRHLKLLLITVASLAAILMAPQVPKILQQDDVSQSLRIYKGFNSRDLIWEASLDVISENILLGVGDIEVSSREIVEAGSTNSTSQNSMLSMLLRVGVLGSLYMIGFFLVGLLQTVKIAASGMTQQQYCLISIFGIFVLDGLFRSYSVGGVGLIPLIGVVAWLCLLDDAERKSN